MLFFTTWYSTNATKCYLLEWFPYRLVLSKTECVNVYIYRAFFLAHFQPMLQFYTPWKYQKTFGDKIIVLNSYAALIKSGYV